MGVVFGLVALFAYAVGDLFVASASRKVGNVRTLFWQLVITFVLTSFYAPLALPVKDIAMLLFSGFLGLILFLGTLSYFKALEIGNASLAGAISGSYSAFVVLLSLIIYNETLSPIQALGILMTVLGVATVSFKWDDIKFLKTKESFSDPGIKYALVAMVLFSLYLTLVKIPASHIGWFWQPYTYSFSFLFILGYSLVKRKTLRLKNAKMSIIPIFISAVLLTLAHFAYNLGVLNGYVSIVGPISGAQAIVFVILAQIFFREKMSTQQALGIITTLLGIFFLSIF